MKIFKYAFVGGVAAIVDISLFVIFAKILQYPYLVVGLVTFLLATFVNYTLSIRFVFQSGAKHNKRKEVLLVYMVSAIGLGLNLLVLFIAHELFILELTFSKLAATGIVFFWNYLSRKYFIF